MNSLKNLVKTLYIIISIKKKTELPIVKNILELKKEHLHTNYIYTFQI